MPDIEKRLRYFDGQFLQEQDFNDEQAYHLDRQRRHNKQFHTPGIAEGLDVTANVGDSQAVVAAGTAVDDEGRQIVLAHSRTMDLSPHAGDTILLLISYDERPSDPASVGGGGDTRWHETPRVEAVPETGAPPTTTHIRLGRVTVTTGGAVSLHETNVRVAAGVSLRGDIELRSLTLSRAGVSPSQWPSLSSGAANRADFSGDLRVSGVIQGALANGLVSTLSIQNNAVTGVKIADNAVNAAKIQDGSVDTAELADGAVTNAKIGNNAVNSAKLGTNAVTTSNIADNAVNAAKIQDGSIGTAKLADGAVTNAKIGNNAVNSAKLGTNAVTTSNIANNAVNAAKIQDGSIGTAKLADGSVSMRKLQTRLVWDSTTTIAANGTAGFNALSVPLSSPRGAILLVDAYTTTSNGSFEWSEISRTGGPTGNLWINQGVYFKNLSSITIVVSFKIYELLPG